MKALLKTISAALCLLLIFPILNIDAFAASANSDSIDFSAQGSLASLSFSSKTIMRGDADADGTVSARDSLKLRKFMVGLIAEIDEDGADANGDGDITSQDVRIVKRVLACIDDPVIASIPCASAEYDAEEGLIKVTALRDGPSVFISLGGIVAPNDLKYTAISALSGTGSVQTLTLNYAGGISDVFSAPVLGPDAYEIFDHTSRPWSGNISSVTVDTDLDAGESIYLRYFVRAASSAAAEYAVDVLEGNETDTLAQIIFNSAENTALLSATNNTTVTYNSAENAAVVAASITSGDPQSAISYEGSGLSADTYKYIVITYKVPSGTSSTATYSQFFLCAGNVTAPNADCNETFTPVKDNAYHYAIISLASASYWTGDIHLIRFDHYSNCAAGDSMIIDSICLAETRADALSIGLDRMSVRGGGVSVSSADTLVNGSSGTMSLYNASSVSGDGTITFSGNTTAIVSGAHASFNRFSIVYSSNAIVRGVAYYTSGGIERADEFFLENTGGATKEFRSLILGYFDAQTADALRLIDLYTINTSSASVKITDIEEETFEYYPQTTYFIENTNLKLGVDLCMGGGVNYYEDKNDGNAQYTNLLNNYDVGRLIQQSYYGIDKAPYELGWWGGHAWQYNPVQGGDKDNNISRVVDFEFVSNSEFYVKARPMDWGQSNRITPSYMENIYTLTESYVKVYNRFVDFSGYTHVNVRQELPAFYTISALKDFYYYGGSSPWTDDGLTKKSDLPFWGTYPNQTTFTLPGNSEFWSAWCDGTGYGIGLYVPDVYTLRAGRHQYNGTANPNADPTNYVSPQRNMTLICGKPLEYSYLIAAGTLTQIRNTFKNNRTQISNYNLAHYNN
ncbi:MAG: dockerin type I repeat-containing protein [Clostridia bacterium]|nr:dockerin type I repeat-containing protein [Clostridia bacterium]